MESQGEPIYISQIATPVAPSSALGTGAGTLTNGVYKYKVTFIKKQGSTVVRESAPSAADSGTTVVDATTNGKITVTIPVSIDPNVTGRRIYRTVHDGSTYKLLTTIDDNSTTTYSDNIADGSLGANAGSAAFVTNELVRSGKMRLSRLIIGKDVSGSDVEVGDSLTTSSNTVQVNSTRLKLSGDTLHGAYELRSDFIYGICITLVAQTQVTLVVSPTN